MVSCRCAAVAVPQRCSWRAAPVASLVNASVDWDTPAAYLRSCPEYLESFAAALKAPMVPVNTNHRGH